MKKIILISILIAYSSSSYAQTYYPFQTDTAQWNVESYDGSRNKGILAHYFYFINGDTLIDSINYSKFFKDRSIVDTIIDTISATYIGGLREENKHIYFKPAERYQGFSLKCGVMNENLDEFLLYRFNLSIGDTFTLNQYSPGLNTVIDIDSIQINNKYRKSFRIRNFFNSFGDDYWIEGIGSQESLFGSTCWVFEGWDRLLCYIDPETDFVGFNNWEGYCISPIVGYNEEEINKIKVYPNPARNKLQISHSNELTIKKINIRNMFGQIIFSSTGDLFELNISELTNGLLIIEIISDDNKFEFKIIKQ